MCLLFPTLAAASFDVRFVQVLRGSADSPENDQHSPLKAITVLRCPITSVGCEATLAF
jgi:hypothetical protein